MKLLTVIAGGLLVVFVVVLAVRDRTPPLSNAAHKAALEAWNRDAPLDYTVVVRKNADGLDEERIESVVEKGKTVRLVLNGNELELQPAIRKP